MARINIAEYTDRSKSLKDKVRDAILSAGLDLSISENNDNTIRLVFAGQYSAGKSSILKMLTGREDIAIGADITTQHAHTYNWKGIEVVDTPGIHTELRPDHDKISYEAITSADMLVFVVTNELFDVYMANHFRKLAIDKDKAGEMILVVNKMDRTAEGNTIGQQNILREDLRKVLKPYTPEQLNLSFLDAESYLDSIEERAGDPELADELLDRSGYEQFVATLNRFVEAKNVSSKLTTDLYLVDECLENAIKELQPKSSDADIDALEENLRQQRYLFVEARRGLWQEVKNVYTIAAKQIREIGSNAANLLVAGCKQDEVEAELNKLVGQAAEVIEKSQYDAADLIGAHLKKMNVQLDVIENSEFSKDIKARLSVKFDGLPNGVKRILTSSGSGLQKAGKFVSDMAYKSGVDGGLKLTNFSGSSIHQMVKDVGHFFNYKFKPWEAVKFTKNIAITGQVFNVLGVGLSVFMQIKSDQDEQKNREDLRINRQNIRSQFNETANGLEEYARQYIKDNVDKPLNDSISKIDEHIQTIRDTRSNRSANCKLFEKLQEDCRCLIKDIHAELGAE